MKTDDLAVGMTTCPRSESYIAESIASMLDKGWPAPLVYHDHDMRGDVWGFVQVCRLLLSAYPTREWLLIVQDDVVACQVPGVVVLPSGNGVHSIFSLLTDERAPDGQYRRMDISDDFQRTVNCNGGCAYLLNRQTAAAVCDTAWAVWSPITKRLGELCFLNDWPYTIYGTNVFEHIGEVPALNRGIEHYRWDVSEAAVHRSQT